MLMEQWIRISNRILKPMWLVLCIAGICFQGVNAQEVLVELPPQRQATTQGENIYLQNLKKNIQFDKNEMMLGKALRYIANHAELKLSYSEELIPLDKKVAIEQGDMTVEQALRMILDGTTLRFGISSTGQLFFLEKQVTRAEEALQVTVSGMVTDAQNGEALPGVNVIVVGSEEEMGSIIGTQTDINGSYSVNVPDALNTLAFTYIGYQRLEVDIDGRSEIDIQLQQDIQMLDNVVVVGYGTMRREDITSSVSSVSSEDFNAGIAIDPLDMIQGRVAGLTISRAGFDPNASAGIQLRGISSIEADRSPLIVIDGIPGADLQNIPQSEIETIDVLKDGSAAAIYGTRGTNGVIVVTTKSGRLNEGETQFDYQTSMQTEMISNRLDVFSAEQYRELISQGLIAENQDFGGNTNWYDEIQQTPFTQDHNFSISRGGENTRYRANVHYRDAKPIMIETSRRSYGGRVNIDHTGFNNRLNVQLNLQSTFVENKYGTNGVSEQAIIRNPTAPVYDEEGSFFDPVGFHNQFNPVARLKQHDEGAERSLFLGNIRGTLELTDWLSASLFYANENNIIKNYTYIGRESYQSRDNDYDGLASRLDQFNKNNTVDFTLESIQNLGQHRVNALAGYSYQDFITETFSAENRDFLTDATSWYDLGAGSFLGSGRASMGTNKSSSTLIGFFGRINYAFDNKYLVTASVRREGSSKFGIENKWGTFSAISLGWRLSNEPFMQGMEIVDDFMIRLGYGETGNQSFSSYQSIATLRSFGNYYDYESGNWISVWGPAQNPNPNLRWEKKKEFNLGLDFTLVQGKIHGELDLYTRTTEDLLFNYDAPMPPSVHSNIFTNVGSIQNRGIELLMETRVINSDSFQWTAGFNWSYLHNKIVKLSDEYYQQGYIEMANLPAPGSLGPSMRIEEGKRIGSFYGYRHAGFTEDGDWLFYKEDGSTSTPAGMSLDDRIYIGNGLPKMNAGLNNRLSYQNWDLSIFFRGEFMYDILNMLPMYYANSTVLGSYNQLQDVLGKYAHINAPTQYSDYYLEKGDYVKLDNISLGYSFDLREYSIRHLRVTATAQNLWTITRYTGLDPEVGSTGLTPGLGGRSFYPRTTVFSLGLNVGF